MTGSRFIRLRGLPWSVTHQEILDFLKDVNVVNGTKGIHLVTNRWDGKNTGEAFVELNSEEDETLAFKYNKGMIGHRYIEIFEASNDEAEHVIRKPGQPVVKLRGLPYAVTDEMIEKFFDGLEIKPDREGILIVKDKRGRATGEAFVQFESQEDTEQALNRNREKIGHRYIEIFLSSITEMKRQTSNCRPGPYDKRDRGAPRAPSIDFTSDYIPRGIRNQRPRGGGFNLGGGGGGPFNGGNNYGGDGGFFENKDLGGFGGGNDFMGRGGRNQMPRAPTNILGGGNQFGGGGGNFNGGGDFGGDFGGDNEFFGRNRGNFVGNSGFRNNNSGGGGGGNGGNFGDFNNFGNSRGGGGGGGGGSGNFNRNGGDFKDSPFPPMSHRGMGNHGDVGNLGNNSNFGFGPIGGGRNEDKLFGIHLRGLPYYCFEGDVNRFFEPIRPVRVKIIYNHKGLHSGSADAFFATHDEANEAMKKHREKMGSRYIELFYDGKVKKDNFRRL